MLNILQWINIIFLAINAGLVYLNFTHNRKKDFEEQLYKLKFDSYREINNECYDVLIAFDVNSTPIVKIYDFENKEDWDKYFLAEVTKLHHVGFALHDLAHKHSIYISEDVIKKLFDYANYCIGYITMCAHYDTGLIIDNYGKLWEKYTDLVDKIRNDLNIKSLDKSLRSRMNGRIR